MVRVAFAVPCNVGGDNWCTIVAKCCFTLCLVKPAVTTGEQ